MFMNYKAERICGQIHSHDMINLKHHEVKSHQQYIQECIDDYNNKIASLSHKSPVGVLSQQEYKDYE